MDDGSVDQTRAEASTAANDSHVKVVGYGKNMGKGYAIKYGVNFASNQYLVLMDSDMDIKPSNLKMYVDSLKHADVAIGSKRHPQSKVSQPIMRKFLSLGFHSIVMLLTGLRVSDTQAGLKVFRTDVLQRVSKLLSVKKYAFDVEVLVVARLLDFKIVELPVNVEMDVQFRVRHIVRMFVDLLGIAYRLRLIRWYHKNMNGASMEYSPLIRW